MIEMKSVPQISGRKPNCESPPRPEKLGCHDVPKKKSVAGNREKKSIVLKISEKTMPMVVRIATQAAAISNARIARSTVLRARKSLLVIM